MQKWTRFYPVVITIQQQIVKKGLNDRKEERAWERGCEWQGDSNYSKLWKQLTSI
jgi:hypothetical protein